MRIDGNERIVTLAADLPGAIAVFESFGLDYACAGERTLYDAAAAEGVPADLVVARLRHLRAPEHAESWHDRSLAELTRYLSDQHHRCTREELASIAIRLADLCTSPVEPPADLLSLRAAFTRLTDILLPHLHREDDAMFPSIVALERSWQSALPQRAQRIDLPRDISRAMAEHAAIAAQLRMIRELRQRLELTANVPARCAALLDDIATLEAHLHEYIFLANCVLFPRAIELDAQAVHA